MKKSRQGITKSVLLYKVAVHHTLNPLYTARLYQCYMLDDCICPCRGVGSILSLYSIIDGKPS